MTTSILNWFQGNIAGLVPGGIMVSHGTWFTAVIFMIVMKIRRAIASRGGR